MLKDEASRTNKNKDNFEVLVLTYPQTDFKPYKTGERIPLTGNIDQIGGDILKIKEMGVSHIIFCYLFSAENNNTKETISLTKHFQSLQDKKYGHLSTLELLPNIAWICYDLTG